MNQAQALPKENQADKPNWIKDKKKYLIVATGIFIFLVIGGLAAYFRINQSKQKTGISTKHELFRQESSEKVATQSPSMVLDQISEINYPIIIYKDSKDIVSVHTIDPQTQKEAKLFDIRKPPIENRYQMEKERPFIQIADNGVIAYKLTVGENTLLFFWNSEEVKERYVSKVDFDFSLSPDGKYVVIFTKEASKDINKVFRQFSETDKWEYVTQHNFYVISLENEIPQEFLLREDLVDTSYDSTTSFRFVGWTQIDSPRPLLQSRADGQLSTTTSGLYELDITSRLITNAYPLLDQKQFYDRIFLKTSFNGNYIAYRKPDHACCGGVNYGNDQTYVFKLSDKSERILFDEHEKYQNTSEDQRWTEQHAAKNLFFSPNHSHVAQTIFHFQRSSANNEEEVNKSRTASLLITDIEGNEQALFNDYTTVGWLDNNRIVAAKTVQSQLDSYYRHWWDNKYNSIDVINVSTGEIKKVYGGSFNDIKIMK